MMTDADLTAVVDRDERRRQMLADPDLGGDLLLVALALDEVITARGECGRHTLGRWVGEVTELAHGTGAHRRRGWVRQVIRTDVPRHEPARTGTPQPCVAPIRGGVCGKTSTWRAVDHDPAGGEARWVGLCGRHRGLQGEFDARRDEWIAAGRPMPAATTGGVLRRYFDADWDGLYAWSGLAPMAGGREATPARPRLRLIHGGVSGEAVS
jgi:hypothetical protein